MCGIVGLIKLGNEPLAPNMAKAMYRQLVTRGKDACGLALVCDNKIIIRKAQGCTTDMLAKWPHVLNEVSQANIVLLHARQATQGTPGDAVNNHPILGRKGFLLHNGMVYYDKTKLSSLGYGESDSGELLWHIERDGLKRSLQQVDGWLAIAHIAYAKRHLVHLYKHSSTLHLGWDVQRKHLLFASTAALIEDAWLDEYGYSAFGLFGLPIATLPSNTIVTINTQAKTVKQVALELDKPTALTGWRQLVFQPQDEADIFALTAEQGYESYCRRFGHRSPDTLTDAEWLEMTDDEWDGWYYHSSSVELQWERYYGTTSTSLIPTVPKDEDLHEYII